MVSVRTSIVRPEPRQPPAETADSSPVATTSQVKALISRLCRVPATEDRTEPLRASQKKLMRSLPAILDTAVKVPQKETPTMIDVPEFTLPEAGIDTTDITLE